MIPCVFLSGLSDAQAKALNIALNNPEAQGEFDDQMLAELLKDVEDAAMDVRAVTGFPTKHWLSWIRPSATLSLSSLSSLSAIHRSVKTNRPATRETSVRKS